MRTLVIRHGAIGDIVQITPVLAELKRRGDYVGLVAKSHAYTLVKPTGLVDKFYIWTAEDEQWTFEQEQPWKLLDHVISRVKMQGYDAGYDKVINLNGVIEGTYLINNQKLKLTWLTKDQRLPQRELVEDNSLWESGQYRHKADNYYDVLLAAAGFPKIKGRKPVYALTTVEERFAADFYDHYGLADKFTVVMQLSGSGGTKQWPYWADYAWRMAELCDGDIQFITTGGLPRDWVTENYLTYVVNGKLTPTITMLHKMHGGQGDTPIVKEGDIRLTAALMSRADLLVTPDTGMLHIAGAFPIPKIAMLAIATLDNVCKYYDNCVVVQSPISCSPCGKIVHSCKPDEMGVSACMKALKPEPVVAETMRVYQQWKDSNGETN